MPLTINNKKFIFMYINCYNVLVGVGVLVVVFVIVIVGVTEGVLVIVGVSVGVTEGVGVGQVWGIKYSHPKLSIILIII